MSSYGNDYGSAFAALGAFLLVLVVVFVAVLIFMIVATWKMYKKAGKNGWESIIPFYSNWVYVEIAGLNWWWFFVSIAGSVITLSTNSSNGETVSFNVGSIIALFGTFVCNYNIAKKLHKDTGFAVLMTIFPVILIPMIAFSDKYTFDNNVSLSKNGPFPDNGATNNGQNNTQQNNTSTNSNGNNFCPHCGAKLDDGAKFCSSCGKEI